MRITNEGMNNVGSVRSKGSVSPHGSVAKATGTSESKDVFSVSQVAALRDKLAVAPDDGVSMLEAIKAQLNSNTYRPDSGAVADSLLREHMQFASR